MGGGEPLNILSTDNFGVVDVSDPLVDAAVALLDAADVTHDNELANITELPGVGHKVVFFNDSTVYRIDPKFLGTGEK